MNEQNHPNNRYYIYGKHAVASALNNKNRQCYNLYATKDSITYLPNLNKSHPNLKISLVDHKTISKLIAHGALHQNLVLEVSSLPEKSIHDLLNKKHDVSCIVALDQLTDPHNVGAILRSAAAFDAHAIILTNDNSPKDLAVLAKTSSGAHEITPIVKVANLSNALQILKNDGYWIIGLDGKADLCLKEIDLKGKIVIVMGSEGNGLRRLTAKNCDFLAKLPISPSIESLNVSNAAAISLYEYYRQNH